MNKKNKVIAVLVAAGAALCGYATAGTVYYNALGEPVCTVCDGTGIIQHAYGTTVCTHCDGTGIEPTEEEIVVNTVVVDSWCPPPPPRRPWPRAMHRGHREHCRPVGHAARPVRGAAARGRDAKSAPAARGRGVKSAPAARPARSAARPGGGGPRARR